MRFQITRALYLYFSKTKIWISGCGQVFYIFSFALLFGLVNRFSMPGIAHATLNYDEIECVVLVWILFGFDFNDKNMQMLTFFFDKWMFFFCDLETSTINAQAISKRSR